MFAVESFENTDGMKTQLLVARRDGGRSERNALVTRPTGQRALEMNELTSSFNHDHAETLERQLERPDPASRLSQ